MKIKTSWFRGALSKNGKKTLEDSPNPENKVPTKHFLKNDKGINKSIKTNGKFFQHAARGAAIGASINAAHYTIQVGGPRNSNIVTFFDNTVKSSHGNPKWFVRIDTPHKNVPFYHINVNKAITGVKDPHTRISALGAQTAGVVSQVINVVNQVAPVLMVASMAYDIYQIRQCMKTDKRNLSSRNTIKKAATTVTGTAGGLSGWAAGTSIGTAVFPGVGTCVGAVIGGLFGGAYAGRACEKYSETIFDKIKYNIDEKTCEKCKKTFQLRRYQEGLTRKFCHDCR
uniref:Gly-zipper_Omp domain-containing protein n=1 Tax=Caenorhabditis tropicalis TaxID=1561998 RepID=A0A1I7UR79_9PELO